MTLVGGVPWPAAGPGLPTARAAGAAEPCLDVRVVAILAPLREGLAAAVSLTSELRLVGTAAALALRGRGVGVLGLAECCSCLRTHAPESLGVEVRGVRDMGVAAKETLRCGVEGRVLGVSVALVGLIWTL